MRGVAVRRARGRRRSPATTPSGRTTCCQRPAPPEFAAGCRRPTSCARSRCSASRATGLQADRPERDRSRNGRRADRPRGVDRRSARLRPRRAPGQNIMTIQGYPDPGAGLRLHLNENTGGCSPRVLEAIRRVQTSDVATYPSYPALVRACASHFEVDPDWVLLTNGLDEGILMAAVGHIARTRALRRGNDHSAASVRSVSELHGRGRRHGHARTARARTSRFRPTRCSRRSRRARG